MQEVLILPPVRKAGPPHPQVFHQPQVLDLMPDEEVVKLALENTEEGATVKDPMAPFQPTETRGESQRVDGLGAGSSHIRAFLGPKTT